MIHFLFGLPVFQGTCVKVPGCTIPGFYPSEIPMIALSDPRGVPGEKSNLMTDESSPATFHMSNDKGPPEVV